MTCNRERLSLYLDGDLDAIDRRGMEDHLSRCPSCRRELRSLRSVDRSVAGLRSRYEPVSRDLDARIRRSVSARRRPRRAAARLSSPAVGTVAAALLLFLGTSHGALFSPQHSPSASGSAVRQRVAQLSAPLAQSRRASAILDGHATLPAEASKGRRAQPKVE